jgi:DNA-binding CsgD family transcriptional regulator
MDSDLLEILSAGHPAAFASDSRERIVFWNRGASELLGRTAEEVLGRHCWEVIAGRDVFGNRFCYGNCPVASSLRAGETVCGFEMKMSANGHGLALTHVTILRIPSIRPDLFTVVHVLEPVEEASRLARTLETLGAQASCAAPWSQAAQAHGAAPPAPPPLTPREREVLGWIARGLQNKEIAQTLDLSLATVRNHIHNILEKLGLHSKLEAVSLAFRSGWVEEASAPSTAPGAGGPAGRQ